MYINFKTIIDKKGITAYKVSKDTGIPYSTLSDWKLGKSKPKYDKLLKIASYLEVSIDDLIKESVMNNECNK